MSIAGSGYETTSIELTLLHGRTFPGEAACRYLGHLYRKVIAIIYVDEELINRTGLLGLYFMFFISLPLPYPLGNV